MSRSLLSTRLQAYLIKAHLNEQEVLIFNTMLSEVLDDLHEELDTQLLLELRTKLDACFKKLVGQVAVVQPVKERFALGLQMQRLWDALLEISKIATAQMEADAEAKANRAKIKTLHERYGKEIRERQNARVTPEQRALLDTKFLRVFNTVSGHLRNRITAISKDHQMTVREMLAMPLEDWDKKGVLGERTRLELIEKLGARGFTLAQLHISEEELQKPC